MLRDAREDQYRLHHSEVRTETNAWPPAERDVAEWVACLCLVGCEAVRIETVGLIPQPAMPMNDQGHDEHLRTLPQGPPGNLVIDQGSSQQSMNGGTKA